MTQSDSNSLIFLATAFLVSCMVGAGPEWLIHQFVITEFHSRSLNTSYFSRRHSLSTLWFACSMSTVSVVLKNQSVCRLLCLTKAGLCVDHFKHQHFSSSWDFSSIIPWLFISLPLYIIKVMLLTFICGFFISSPSMFSFCITCSLTYLFHRRALWCVQLLRHTFVLFLLLCSAEWVDPHRLSSSACPLGVCHPSRPSLDAC